MPRTKQQKLGLLLFAILFRKQPLVRQLFLKADIAKQSLRLLDMFAWLLKSLIKDKNHMRVRALQSIGERHISYGVKREYFAPMLDSLNEALLEMCAKEYTVKTRVALTLLFQSACNEMMRYAGYDANELPFQQQNENFEKNNQSYAQKYRFLRSIDHTLADPTGFMALEAFLKKAYCGELTEFHKAYRIYRCCLAPKVREEIAKEIIKLFLTQGAPLELNDASENRLKIQATVQKCDEQGSDYPLLLFDETHTWVKFQISQDWVRFRKSMQQQ
jgi:hemoglobin-like flavoprotein